MGAGWKGRGEKIGDVCNNVNTTRTKKTLKKKKPSLKLRYAKF